ncbi:MAG: hypothetical protein COB53_02840 [Elusimicrobia bacterium]|nr:MAG: hypothetical protein COB53_02840 [Elusimicrobiota bacterium]
MILQNWWYSTLMGVSSPMCPPLKGEIKTDVLVIGGGAAGLAAALCSTQSGAKTVLLERNLCGGGTTGKSAGFLTPDSELELDQLLRRFGPEGARDLWDAGTSGVDLMRGAIKQFGFDCDLQEQDSLYVAKSRGSAHAIEAEFNTRKKLGYDADLYNTDRLPEAMNSTGYYAGVRYPGTFSLNPLLYSQGVKRGLLELGCTIHEASTVTRIDGHTVYTDLGSVTADQILFCIDKPQERLTKFSWNVYNAQTFLAVSEPLGDKLISKLFPNGTLQCWDSDLLYSYWRLTGDGRMLLGGGSLLTSFAGRDVTDPSVIRSVIDSWRRYYPSLKDVEFIQYWPGRIDMTRDLLPTITIDEDRPWVHHVLGCVGLPWASFCGDFVARHALNTEKENDSRFYKFLSPKRGFLIPLWVERLIGKRIVFSLNTAWAKFYQVDRGETVDAGEEDF